MRDTPITEERRVVCYNHTVYDDMRLELMEYFGLTMAVGSSTALTTIDPIYSQTAIKIIDNDDLAVVGLEHTLYYDTEGVGVVEVCVVVHTPDIDCPIAFPFTLSLSTNSGASSNITFNMCEKRRCANIGVVLFRLEKTPHLEDRITLDPVEGKVLHVVMGFEQAVYTVMEDAGSFQACVVVRAPEERQLTFYTEDDTAYAGRDYTHTEVDTVISERLCIDIPIINNYLPGSDVQFSLKATSTNLTTSIVPSAVVIMDDDIPRGCTYEVVNASVAEEKAREEVVVTIANILTFTASLGDIRGNYMDKLTDEPPLNTAYIAIVKEFELPATDDGYRNFTTAVSQITEAKMAACRVSNNISEDDIPGLWTEYRAMRENIETNIEQMRGIFGKMLCLQERSHTDKQRKGRDANSLERENCSCPGAEEELFSVCEFFRCLDPDDDLKPIMGLYDIGLTCLAFTVDTTSSMGGEIAAVKVVVKNFLRSEEDGPGCYVLQPFNDYTDGIFDPASIHEATVATTYNEESIFELEAFLNATESMYAHEGGDSRERQLRALLKTLHTTHSDEIGTYSVMDPGSEIVLLTDAPSHDIHLKDDVITNATTKKVCISFFLSELNAVLFKPYHEIAIATGGIVVKSINEESFSSFISEHVKGHCAQRYFQERNSRQAPPSSYDTEQSCHYFTTSLLTDTLTVQGYTSQDAMIVTKPNGEEVIVITNSRGDKLYRDSAPLSGQWSVCVENGTLTITIDAINSISSTLQYLTPIPTSTELILNYSPPPACTEGYLALETAKFAEIGSMSIDLLDDESDEVLTTVPFYRCANRLLGSVLFPQARVTFRAVGNDVNGRPFSTSLSEIATFVQTSKVIIEGENPIEVDHGQTIYLTLTIYNHDINDTHYTFTADPVTGFRQVFRPTSLIVHQGGIGSVQMIILQHGAESGSSYTFIANAISNCGIHSASKTVSIQMPVTTPPPISDECGCENGGTCIVRIIRGRRILRCYCPDEFIGSRCEHYTG